MSRSNAWLPTLLTLLHVAAFAFMAVVFYRWLPATDIRVVGSVGEALRLIVKPALDPMLRSGLTEHLATSWIYLRQSTAVYIWLIGSVLLALVPAWLMQLLMSGLQPAWRYLLGATVLLTTTAAVGWLGGRVGLALPGGIIGVMAGEFLGWWVAVGYWRTSQRQTDARTVRQDLAFARPFDPLRYFNRRKGTFVGLDRRRRPVHVPLATARKHVQLLGETRQGKTVAATVLLAQSALQGETVIVLDPKADRHAPGVLKAAAERAGVPFVYLDLRPDQPPQLALLDGASPHEIEELLISCFDLQSKGTDADVYRVEDRAAARKLAASGAATFAELVQSGAADEQITAARKFWEDLRELAAHPVLHTRAGLRLDQVIGRPGVLYVVGSPRHDNTIRLQKLVLLRLLQLLDRVGSRADAGWTALFVDEFKYLLSPAALRALGTIGDRRCHLIIAHQSLGDLRDCAGLDPEAVYGAVVVNTGLKLVYKTNDPATAEWGATLSGDIPTYAETIAKSPATAPGGYQERTRALIDRNTLLALPPLMGMLFGAGVAQLVCVHFLPAATEPPAVTPAPADALPVSGEAMI